MQNVLLAICLSGSTHTTNFLLHHITTVATTGRRNEQAFSDEGLYQRSKCRRKYYLVEINVIFTLTAYITVVYFMQLLQ